MMKIDGNLNIPAINSGNKAGAVSNNKFDFKKMLLDEVNKVNDAELESNRLDKALITGNAENIHEVMIAAQKAEITLDFSVQVKNKAVEAYKEIMRIQL